MAAGEEKQRQARIKQHRHLGHQPRSQAALRRRTLDGARRRPGPPLPGGYAAHVPVGVPAEAVHQHVDHGGVVPHHIPRQPL